MISKRPLIIHWIIHFDNSSRELQCKLQGCVVQAQQRRRAVDIARLRNTTSADISELDVMVYVQTGVMERKAITIKLSE